MGLDKLIFWEKYRPKSTKGMVLLPRIEKYITEINSNLIFYGTHGTGKTTLAKIIANDFNTITLSGRLGVDILFEKIKSHLDSFNLLEVDKQKLVFVDEFDRASIVMMDSMKAFIEEYSHVRFIFTTNHIDKITDELRSRFICIPFDPINSTEREFMYKRQVSYLRAVAKKEGYEGFNNIEVFEHLVNKNFPDLRASVESLQYVIKSGGDGTMISDYTSDKVDLYKFILQGDMNPIANYDFVMNNYFTNFDDAFKYLSRPFFEYLKDLYIDTIINKGALILKKQKEYNESLENTIDPIIHLVNYIIDLKTVLK